jgi:hypothetical protein
MGKATGVPEHVLSPDAKRLRKERELEDKNTLELTMMRKGDGRDDYGTSLGAGAAAAGTEASNKAWAEGKSLREMEPDVRKAMREAAAQERREARGMKKGGSVKSASSRADGIAQRGKTRGKVVMCGGGMAYKGKK